ncbi:septation protein SepH [Nocardioides plantarum]|uniref:Septation protein SepH n=1 Tax=Nocardioides plantarum TaxID=29299 RepID=A0ABV5K564_9ACTN|nr:septation protein SepH [Nocardioides plantarum]
MERAEQVVEPVDPALSRRSTPADAEPAIPHELGLSLAGVSDDRTRLLLVDERGGTFTLAVTPSLRAALRGDASRLGQLEIPMTSVLRPKDIQARIRSGETAEQVAQAAQTSVDKIMAFVAPVLAERAHVAERAQRSNVRRSAGESPQGGRTLGEAVESHLRSLNLDPDGVEWDAWKREDGRWALTAGYALPVRTGTAHLTFDVPGNYVVLDDADARWLVGEIVASPAPARDDLSSVRERRLTSIPQDELPLGDDAIELVADAPADLTVGLTPDVTTEESYDDPVEAFLDASPASDDPALRDEAADAAAEEPDPVLTTEPAPEPSEPDEPAGRRTVQKKKGRASVPSWDEIMFGPSDQ